MPHRLPGPTKNSVLLLDDTYTSMENFFTTANPEPAALAIELMDLESALRLPSSTDSFELQGSNMKVSIQAVNSLSGGFITSLDSLVTDLTALQILDSQLSGYSDGNAALYGALKTSADAVATNADSALATTSNIQSSQGTTWDATDNLSSAVPTIRNQLQVKCFFAFSKG